MNIFKGTITRMTAHDSFRIVDVAVNGCPVHIVTLELDERFKRSGRVCLLSKESDIIIAKNRLGPLSIENRYPSTIMALTGGRVFSEVIMESPLGPITALISRHMQDTLRLAVGDRVHACVRANEIAIMGED